MKIEKINLADDIELSISSWDNEKKFFYISIIDNHPKKRMINYTYRSTISGVEEFKKKAMEVTKNCLNKQEKIEFLKRL